MKQEENNTQILNDEEVQILQATQEGEIDRSTLPPHDNSDLAVAKRYIKKNKFPTALVVLTVVLLIAVIGVLSFMLAKAIMNRPSTDDFSITVITGDTPNEYVIPYKTAMIDDEFYMDMRKLASYMNLVVSGGNGNLKFTCPDNADTNYTDTTYVRFENGSETATINGVRVKLGGTAKITDTECLIPYSFIEKLFASSQIDGNPSVRTKFSNKDNTVIIRRVSYSNGTLLPLSLSTNGFELAEDMQMKKYAELYPNIASACVKMSLLVNKNNPLGSEYAPEGLFSLNNMNCPTVEGRSFELVSDAAISLTAMLKEMEADLGASQRVLVTSAYRSYERQEYLFHKYVDEKIALGKTEEEAIADVARTSARPGESEHQSGLCVDLIEPGKLNLDTSFEESKAFAWLSQNAHKFGFILRYPSGKEQITGYDYEPWHYRFVGIDAATVIHEDNICLEEYLSKY